MNTSLSPITSAPAAELLKHVTTVYTDLDGTMLAPGGKFLRNAHGEPSLALADAILRLQAAGITIIPVTGRSRLQLNELARLLGFDAFMGELGSVQSYFDGKSWEVFYDTGLWPKDALLQNETPFQAIERVGAPGRISEAFPGHFERHLPWGKNREVSHLYRGSVDAQRAQEILDTLELPISLLNNGTINPPKHTLQYDGPIYSYHLVPSGTSKASAIALDMERRGIACGESLAIGDSAVDVAMGEKTAVFVAVANALENEAVREALQERTGATFVTQGETCDGWVEFADALLASRS